MSIDVGGNIIASDDVNSSGLVTNLAQYDLPTTSLLYHLNAHSYTGASPWYDNAQNIQMTVSGTVNSKTTISGIPAMSFNNSGYWESSTAAGQACDMTGEFTLVMVLYAQAQSARRTVFEKIPNTYSSYEQELACTWETDGTISFYTQYNSYDYATTQVLTQDAWNLWAISVNANRQSGWYWKNGVWNSCLNNRSDTPPVLANGIRIGSGYAGTVITGSMHSCLIYGAALNSTTMTQVQNYYTNLFSLAGATLVT